MGIKEKDAPTEGFAGSVLLKGLLSAACDLGSGPGARAGEVMGHGPNLHDPWWQNMRGSSFENEIPKGLAVPLPALGVWKEVVVVQMLSWTKTEQGLAGGLLMPLCQP